MKTFAALVLAGCLAAVGCAESGTTQADTDTDTTAEVLSASHRIEAQVSGMDCNGCTSSVCSAVTQIAGVTGAAADLETGTVTIALEPDADADAAKAQIEQAITGLSDGKFAVGEVQAISPDDQATPQATN